jgi:Uma2 family endonuclease
MSAMKPWSLLRIEYETAAEEYLGSLPPEHFMEATSQATQRKITEESLDLVQAHSPDVQTFSELLVQYPLAGHERLRQVVPDNMVVLWPERLEANRSYDLPLQPVGPFWVLEYISTGSWRKDYEGNFRKYKQELKVPYYLLFYLQHQDLALYRHSGSGYDTVPSNEQGRFPLPEVDLEVGLLAGWLRYWFKGELLPLPPELLSALAQEKRLREEAEYRAEELERRRREAERGWEEEQRARLVLEQRVAELQAQLQQRASLPQPPA